MIIRSLTLENWGPYAGTQRLEFATPRDGQNVHLVMGNNGGGKTTLLQAMIVCMHGRESVKVLDSDEPLRRENHQLTYDRMLRDKLSQTGEAGPDGERQMALTLELEEEGGRPFIISRRWWFDAGNPEQPEESVTVTVNGEPYAPTSGAKDDRDDEINALVQARMPVNITKFFFFDGEKIQSIAQSDPGMEVVRGLDSLLGFHLIEQLSKDIKKAEQDFRGTEREEIKVSKELTALRADVAQIELELKGFESDLAEWRGELEEIDDEIRVLQHRGSVSPTGDRKSKLDLIQEIKEREGERARLRREVAKKVAELAPAFPADAVSGAIARVQGEQALRTWQSQLDQLAPEAEKLIDRVLGPSAPASNPPLTDAQSGFYRERVRVEWQHILQPPPEEAPDVPWFEEFSSDELTAVGRYLGQLVHRTQDDIRDRLAQDQELFQVAQRLQERVDNYEANAQEQAEVERLQSLHERRGQLNGEIERIGTEHSLRSNDLSDKKSELAKKEAQAAGLSLVEECINVSSDIEATLKEFRDELRRSRVTELERKIEEMMASLAHKGSGLVDDVDIDPVDFRLIFKNAAGNEVSQPSAGEKEILALSMIWALGQISRRDLPVVIDTPLGRLDQTHRSNVVGRFLPQAANQVIVLATDAEMDDGRIAMLQDHMVDLHHLDHDPDRSVTTIRSEKVGA